MSDALKADEVERIAQLARLALTDEERTLYATQLTRILDYARQIAALPTEGVPPTTRVDGVTTLERADAPHASLPRDAALANAPETVAGLFLVPLVGSGLAEPHAARPGEDKATPGGEDGTTGAREATCR